MVRIGDKVFVTGGYDFAEWLMGGEGYTGEAVGFLSEGNVQKKGLVLDLGNEVTIGKVTGRYLILSLRYVGATWEDEGIVHVVIAASIPDDTGWTWDFQTEPDPEQGFEWVEAAASYKVIRDGSSPN